MLAAAFQPKLAPHRPARRSRWAPRPAQQRRRPPPTRSRAPKRLPRPSDRPRPLPSPPTCSLAVRASMPVGPQGNPQVRASAVPGPEEDREVAHAAFMSAYGQSHHGPHIKGMQEFAGAVSCGCRAGPGRAGKRGQWTAHGLAACGRAHCLQCVCIHGWHPEPVHGSAGMSQIARKLGHLAALLQTRLVPGGSTRSRRHGSCTAVPPAHWAPRPVCPAAAAGAAAHPLWPVR